MQKHNNIMIDTIDSLANAIAQGLEKVTISNRTYKNLPRPQRTGTIGQRRAYALMKAREVYEKQPLIS